MYAGMLPEQKRIGLQSKVLKPLIAIILRDNEPFDLFDVYLAGNFFDASRLRFKFNHKAQLLALYGTLTAKTNKWITLSRTIGSPVYTVHTVQIVLIALPPYNI